MKKGNQIVLAEKNSIHVASANRYEIEDKYGSNAALDIFLAI